jgi:hypothetical protein
MGWMRSIVIALVVAVGATMPAQARVRTIAPPGSSGISQYDETVPTAGGSRPTSTFHSVGVGSRGSGGSGSAGGGAIALSTQHALAASGPAGAAAAALAQATAPNRRRPASKRKGRAGALVSASSSGSVASPVGTLLKAVTGSTSRGGFGPVLPIILIGSLLGAAALAFMRRRRTDGPGGP